MRTRELLLHPNLPRDLATPETFNHPRLVDCARGLHAVLEPRPLLTTDQTQNQDLVRAGGTLDTLYTTHDHDWAATTNGPHDPFALVRAAVSKALDHATALLPETAALHTRLLELLADLQPLPTPHG